MRETSFANLHFPPLKSPRVSPYAPNLGSESVGHGPPQNRMLSVLGQIETQSMANSESCSDNGRSTPKSFFFEIGVTRGLS